MNRILQILKSNVFPLLIILICGILAWKNYIPNTILSGWDTLHPEFNFWLYFKRALNGVWMEHQGLGAVASQSHPAEITKLLIYSFLNIILPINLVRYSFIFVCLTFGALGIYYFSKYLLNIKWHKNIEASSFLAALFYIFNLTTVQQFYVPLEMFTVHFAVVPWLFLYGLKYVREHKNKNLITFAIISLFSSSMAHTATLFYVYLISISLFLFLQNFKKTFILGLIILLINSYWIFPNLYYIKNHSNEVSNSKIHSNFTDEAFMQSQSYGDLNNLSLSKNFLFNWGEYNFKENKFVDLLDEWKLHLENPYVKLIGYLLFGISIFGFIIAIVFKSWPFAALALPFTLSVFFWINENTPLTNLFIFLRENFPLVKEGLRFPFTKFSLIYILVLSVWFGIGSRIIIVVLNKVKLGFIYVLIIVCSLFYFQLPQFHGYLISPSMKVQIPSNYFEVFKWFDLQDENSRVAKLPMNTYWGWVYNEWGYQGAGFTWFGIKQPIIEREFDRWSPHNETFFNQASIALYNNDEVSFKKVLEKYNVKYLLLDESIINPGQDKESLKYQETKDLLNTLGFVESFKSGFLTVYDTGMATENVSALNSYAPINADLTYSKFDPVYEKYGNYIQDNNALTLPFVNFDTRGEVKFEIVDDKLQIKNKSKNVRVELQINEKIVEDFDKSHGYAETTNCDLMKTGSVKRFQELNSRRYRAENGGVACDYFVYDQLKYGIPYVMHVNGKNKEGRSLKIYLYNWESKRVELEELLPTGDFDSYYVIYPKKEITPETSSGFTLNVETRSFGRIASENIINKIEFVPFDLMLVQSLYIDPKHVVQVPQYDLQINNVKKYGTAIYKVETSGSGVIELGQGYEKGWISYPKLEHAKVNGWANGWIVPSDQVTNHQVIIFFWPQFLEWGGFLLLLLTFIFIIVKSKKFS